MDQEDQVMEEQEVDHMDHVTHKNLNQKVIVFFLASRYEGGNSNKGFGSGSGFGGQSKYAGGGSTTGFGSETSKGFGSDSHYDDTRKAGKWRVEKTDEPSKPSESEVNKKPPTLYINSLSQREDILLKLEPSMNLLPKKSLLKNLLKRELLL